MLTPAEIKRLIKDDDKSKRKMAARVGERYYEAQHDILDYVVMYTDGDGVMQVDETKSNIRIPHAFFSEIVDQKAQYLLSNPDMLIRSDNPELQSELDARFGDEFVDQLTELATYASVHGWGYVYAYMGDDGRTHFDFASCLSVTEVDPEQAEDGEAHVLYVYRTPRGKDQIVTHVQDWTETEVYSYISVSKDDEIKKLEEDPAISPNPRPHKLYQESQGGQMFGSDYGRIPFFRMDNNRNQKSDLSAIKALIDDYDLMACGLSNNLQDITEGIYVVKGWEGDNLSTLIENVRKKKTIGLPEGGDLDVRTISVPFEARQAKLDLDQMNIYRFGMAFNSAQVGDGNVTNVVIKSRYALLDLKCNKAEMRLRALLWQLVDCALEEINRTNGTAHERSNVWLDLSRTIISSELDDENIKRARAERQLTELNQIMLAAPLLDDDTVVQTICEILDIDYEEIKDKLPKDPYDLSAAAKMLEDAEATAPPISGGADA